MALPLIAGFLRVAGGLFGRGGMARIAGSFSDNLQRSLKSAGKQGLLRPDIKVDTRAFDKAFAEYMKFSKRDISEIVNTKAYYICRNAVLLTDTVDKNKIESELRASSDKFPGVPLAAILSAKAQKRERFSKKTGKRLKNKAGLYGARMAAAVEKLVRVRKSRSNFLRSGWIPAIKELERFVPTKGGPSYPKVKIHGVPKGGGKGAPKDGVWKAVASIWNSVTGGTNMHNLAKSNDPAKVQAILEKGLQKAIAKEVASMKAYVEKKLQARANKFNRS